MKNYEIIILHKLRKTRNIIKIEDTLRTIPEIILDKGSICDAAIL